MLLPTHAALSFASPISLQIAHQSARIAFVEESCTIAQTVSNEPIDDLQTASSKIANKPALPETSQSDIVGTARRRGTPADPLAAINARSYAATQAFDGAITGPAAVAYQRHVPSPIRDGLHNLFLNLHEPDVFLNYMVQLKPGKAAETVVRFAINSTIGLAGLFDMAAKKPFRLPRRPNSLADTLGYYGVKPGPFFYVPLIGPTTLRDFVGNGIDGLLLPTVVGKPFNGLTYTMPSTVIRALDHRARFDDTLTTLHEADDPYRASRRYYLERRQAEIDHLRGRL